jgi:carnitine O-acetyltransferase
MRRVGLPTSAFSQPRFSIVYQPLHSFGSGNSRWFDKSLTMTISANGRMSWNAEHACCDAIVMGRMIDYVYSHEQPPAQRANYTDFSSKLSAPISLLQFAVDDVIAKTLKEAPSYALALKSSVDICVKASPFGKASMKKLGVSPDGFIQMALQLAWANEQHGRQHIFPNT